MWSIKSDIALPGITVEAGQKYYYSFTLNVLSGLGVILPRFSMISALPSPVEVNVNSMGAISWPMGRLNAPPKVDQSSAFSSCYPHCYQADRRCGGLQSV